MNNATDEGRLTVSVTEAAQLLGVSRNAAYGGVQDGSIPSIRIGRRIVVPRRGLEELLGGPLPEPPAGRGES